MILCQILLHAIHLQFFILKHENMMRELLRFNNKVFVNVRHNHYDKSMHGVKYPFSASAISLQKIKTNASRFYPEADFEWGTQRLGWR